jgi:hypothetical protein
LANLPKPAQGKALAILYSILDPPPMLQREWDITDKKLT